MFISTHSTNKEQHQQLSSVSKH